MSNIVIPPTPTILRIASLIDQAISRFLQVRETVPPLGMFESDIEAMKLLNLVIRDIEAIVELAKVDLVLVPAANVLARAVFEIAVKAAWMVTPDDPFDRELRWLAHLQEEERMHKRIAGKVERLGGNPSGFQQRHDSIHAFRMGVISA